MLISQQPKALERLNWYQMIAMTMFFNHVIKYIHKQAILMLKYSREVQVLEKITDKRRWYTNKIDDSSATEKLERA